MGDKTMKDKQIRRIHKYKYKCPLCNGCGEITGKRQYPPEIRKKARRLFAKGLSLRQIGKQINVKAAQQVKSLIMAKIL